MDTPLISNIFKQLFHSPLCKRRQAQYQALRAYCSRTKSSTSLHRHTISPPHFGQHRYFHNDLPKLALRRDWHPRNQQLGADMSAEFNKYPMVTAAQLARRKERPRMVKMLVRDYIDENELKDFLDALYNPNYGYFSKEAVIFSSESFDFKNMKSDNAFQRLLAQRYIDFEDKLDKDEPNEIRQLWHTPTELFRPYYGEAIARYLHESYLDLYPAYDLIIYEMGAGNGTLMVNILDYLREQCPDVYIRTQFKVIEISSRLADRQRRAVAKSGHTDHVEIINTSIFNFEKYVSSPCFFLALEIFDNFAHDMIRYDPKTEMPLQGFVLIDRDGEFHEFYSQQFDPEVLRYFEMRQRIFDPENDQAFENIIASSFAHGRRNVGPLRNLWNRMRRNASFSSNLTPPEFIPTRLMQFFEILKSRFPHHRLLTSDFHTLPDTIEGVNAPVVQTRYQRTTVPVSTLFVQQGYFDILFPTDFHLMSQMYQLITGKFTQVSTHEEFMREWAELKGTTTKSRENPLLNWYKNASVMCSI